MLIVDGIFDGIFVVSSFSPPSSGFPLLLRGFPPLYHRGYTPAL
jgi:hypothetical protein